MFCKEISKLYEEYIRKNIDELELFNNELKGELTIVISEKKEENTSQKLSESDINLIKKMINKLSIKEITNLFSQNKPKYIATPIIGSNHIIPLSPKPSGCPFIPK